MAVVVKVVCDACGSIVDVEGAVRPNKGLQGASLSFPLPLGWLWMWDHRNCAMYCGCKPACRAVIELRHFPDDAPKS